VYNVNKFPSKYQNYSSETVLEGEYPLERHFSGSPVDSLSRKYQSTVQIIVFTGHD
jgi:hypothetical protein